MKNAHSVNVDNREGGFLAGEYLLNRGKKKIGLICGWPLKKTKYGFSYATAERKAGFEEALKQYVMKFNEKYIELATNYSIQEGIKIFNEFMKKSIKLDAIFCASGDMTAMGIMEGARKQGIRIPQDLAVIGYDDSLSSAFLDPPLSTIRQPIEKLGAEVFNMVNDAIEGKLDVFKHIEIEPELVIRQSA